MKFKIIIILLLTIGCSNEDPLPLGYYLHEGGEKEWKSDIVGFPTYSFRHDHHFKLSWSPFTGHWDISSVDPLTILKLDVPAYGGLSREYIIEYLDQNTLIVKYGTTSETWRKIK